MLCKFRHGCHTVYRGRECSSMPVHVAVGVFVCSFIYTYIYILFLCACQWLDHV